MPGSGLSQSQLQALRGRCRLSCGAQTSNEARLWGLTQGLGWTGLALGWVHIHRGGLRNAGCSEEDCETSTMAWHLICRVVLDAMTETTGSLYQCTDARTSGAGVQLSCTRVQQPSGGCFEPRACALR